MFLFILIIVIFVLLLILVLNHRKDIKHVKLYNELKIDLKCFPIIQHAYLFFDRMKGIQAVSREILKPKLNGIGAGWFANKLYCFVADPETAEVVLKKCFEKDFTMKFMKTILGNGTIIAPVPIWRVRRKILTTSFSVKNLNGFVDVFSCQSKIMADTLQDVDSKPVSIHKFISSCAMDSVYECILGIQIGSQNSKKKPLIQAWDDFRDSIAIRAFRPWLHSDFIYNLLPLASKIKKHKSFLQGVADEAINQKNKEMQQTVQEDQITNANQNSSIKTFLEVLISASQKIGGYKNSELQEETLVLAFASSDSSTVGASFTCLMLARHPEAQEKIYEEIKEVFGDTTRPVTPEDLLRLKYLEAFIKETIRLYPPIPIIVREVLDDVILPSGLTLPKNMGIIINIWALHRNPRYWGPDAEVFKPERFLNLTLEHPAQYMPFSYGPRNCLGSQFAMTLMKTLISTIMKKYKILPAKSLDEPVRVRYDITIKDADEFMVRLEPRGN